MSWGYFAELDLRLPTTSLAALKSARPEDVELDPGWSGLRDRALEAALGRRIAKGKTFGETLGWYRGEGSRQREEVTGDRAQLRVLTMLEKSILDRAYPLATLLFAAAERGGEGTLRLVNDGTAGGETGVELTLAGGKIASRRLPDDWELVARWGEELYTLPIATPAVLPINPVTGQPVDLEEFRAFQASNLRKIAAQKKAAQAPLAKKAPAKKAATKAKPATKSAKPRKTRGSPR